MNRKSLGIYIHIPFCVQKCLYCDFISGPADLTTKENYVNCMLEEIVNRAKKLSWFDEKKYIVDTVFIGGGTPSVLPAEEIERILCKLRGGFEMASDCECSIEVNPGTVDANKLKKYRAAGINRLSIGLQSCNDNELKALGRIHDYKTFEETFRLARENGFENINVDLMSSVPEQTTESFVKSLKCVAEMEPEHISVYSLIVEEGTPFYRMDLNLPSEEEERFIYQETGRILNDYGYTQYEISNYAKAKKECKHNIRYWKCKEYLGFGVAAASYLNGIRWKNTTSVKKYTENMIPSVPKDICCEESGMHEDSFYEEMECLTKKDEYAEFMFMGLRMNEGISKEEFKSRFGVCAEDVYGEILSKHIQNNLLEADRKSIKLTDKGRDVANYVMADFILLE